MRLTVNGTDREIRRVNTYHVRYGWGSRIAYYSSVIFKEKLSCEIHFEKEIKSVVIRPLNLHIPVEVVGDKVCFTLESPCNISVEINEDIQDALLLFAEEKDYLPQSGYEHLIYYPAGETVAGHIQIHEKNTLVFLEEGAVVHGKITAENADYLTICGNGILTMESFEREDKELLRCLDILHSDYVVVKNVKLIDSSCWTFRIYDCNHVTVDHVRIIGGRGNSDGIDVCGSREVQIRNCFIRAADDSLVVKAFDTGNAEHLLFENCILWNDSGRPMEIGVELRAERIYDVIFRNMDIIHSCAGCPCMGIHHGDRAEISKIRFENIRIEDAPGAQLFDARITDSVWNEDRKKGRIYDVIIENISLIGKPGIIVLPTPSRLQGFSDEADIEKVLFRKVSFLGKLAGSLEDCGVLLQDYVRDVRYETGAEEGTDATSAEESEMHRILTRIEEGKKLTLNADGRYQGSIVVSAYNREARMRSCRFRLQINPVASSCFDSSLQELQLPAMEEVQKEFDVELMPGKYVFSVQADDCDISMSWMYRSLDLLIGNSLESASQYNITDYFGNRSEGFWFAVENGYFTIKSEELKTKNALIYTAMPVEIREGQALFTAPETEGGWIPGIIAGKQGLELAPQLRNPLEITMVFQNEPKVERIVKRKIEKKIEGVVRVPLTYLGLPQDVRNFWFELVLPMEGERRYPFAMFQSTAPEFTAHMFVNAVRM